MFKLRVSLFQLCFLAVGSLMLASGAALAGHGGGGHGGGGHGGGGHGGAHFGGAHFAGVGVGRVGGVGVGVGRVGGVGVAVPRFGVGGVGALGVARFGAFNPALARINRTFVVVPGFGGARFARGLGFGGLGFGLGYGLGLGYGYGGYGYGYGGYGGYGYGGYAYGAPLYNTYTSYYAPDSQTQQQLPQPDDAAHILVVVPSDAELWFNGTKTSQTGTQRDFVSPVLTLGKNYTYEVKARWTEDGKPVEQTRSVHVQANSWQVVDFTRSETSPKAPAPPK
jgi:uncharacterized protein (TIGR03000 family)